MRSIKHIKKQVIFLHKQDGATEIYKEEEI